METVWRKIKGVFAAVYTSFQRFPVTVLSSILLAAAIIWLSEKTSVLDNDAIQMWVRMNMSLGLFTIASLTSGLVNEQYFTNKGSIRILTYIFALVISILFHQIYLTELTNATMMRYTSLMLVFVVVPFFAQKLRMTDFYEVYVLKILNGILTTVIYAAVLYAGISIIMFTISSLFSVNIASKYYFYSWILVVLVFAVTFFLSKVPLPKADHSAFTYPDALKILLVYIVIPLITVYTLILYVYFIRILITGEWPQGLVSHLVLWYSTVSVGVIFLLMPVYEKNRVSLMFRNWFPVVILPVLGMMFASIYLRINQYGFTENRYLIVILGLWVTAIMIYFATKRFNRNIVIPISLAIVIFISSFGPLSSFAVSIRSQNRRFERILTTNGMIASGTVTPNPSIPIGEKREISNIISYFINMHDLKQIAVLPDDFVIADMPEVFGFEFQPQYHTPPSNYFFFHSDATQQPLRIDEYDYYFVVNQWNTENRSIDDIRVDFSMANLILTIRKGTTEPLLIDLAPFAQEIYAKYAQNILQERDMQISPENMTFTGENEMMRYSITFANVSGYTNEDGLPIYENIDLILLLGIK